MSLASHWRDRISGKQAPDAAMPLAARADLLVCAECDALYARRALASDALLRCRRCGAQLARGHWLAADGQLALSVAAALVYAIATLSPIVTLELRGVDSVATMLDATRLTWAAGEHLVAVLAAATVIVFPLLVILLRLWVLAPMVAGRPAPALVPALHALRWLTRWSMVEVFMLAVLIAVVRSAGVTNVVLGAGIFAYGTLAVLLAAVQATGMEGLWQQVRPDST